MLVCSTLGAPSRRRWRRARAKPADPKAPAEPLPLARLTVVTTEELRDVREAERWIERVARDPEAAQTYVDRALRLINRALHAHAAAAQDPYVTEVSAQRAVATRLGYGEGEQVAEGVWTDARELVHRRPRRRRADSLQPQERVAAVLGGRETVSASETVLLRARLDLDQGRAREAALELRTGLAALLAELAPRAGAREQEQLADLRRREASITALAEAALAGELDADADAEPMLAETLARCERALRRRRLRPDP